MTRTLVKTDAVAVDDQSYQARYFARRTPRGLPRYSVEIAVGPDDCVILDDDSITTLEVRAARLIRATLYSRTLARTA
jgi:hypothetical protein